MASIAERLRAWAEQVWAAEESQYDRGGRLIDGVIVPDPPRPDPFASREMAVTP